MANEGIQYLSMSHTLRMKRKGLLNSDDINGQISSLRRDMTEALGLFKNARLARPQLFLRAEHTGSM